MLEGPRQNTPNLQQNLIRSNEDVYITIDEIESYYKGNLKENLQIKIQQMPLFFQMLT